MIIKLYNTNSDNNKLNKVLTNEIIIDIKLKNDTDIIRPTIFLYSETLINSNYCYIPEFNRHYYINSITTNPNKVFKLELEVDVLMSFKNDILNSYAYVIQQTNYNNYYNSSYQSEVRKEVDYYYSDVTLSDEKSLILVTVGGGV